MVSDMSKINTYKISDKDKNKLLEDSFNMYYYLFYNKIKNNNTKEIKDLITLIGYDNFVILINNIKESYRKQRISKAKISDRKYDLKYICDKDLNYLKRNQINGFIKYDNVVYQIDDYISKFIKTDEESEISNVLKTYIYPRIPECGYFMLKNGKKILPNDLINSYLVYLLKKDMKLVDVMEVMKGLVLSSREQVHKMELERINANYQRVAITLDNVINRYDKDNQLLGGKVL